MFVYTDIYILISTVDVFVGKATIGKTIASRSVSQMCVCVCIYTYIHTHPYIHIYTW